MFSGFQSNAFQNNAFQIIAGSRRDTHDGWIPEGLIRKFYENERLKHSKVISTYKKLIKTEEKAEEIKEIIREYTPDTSKLSKNVLNEIAEDKKTLAKLLMAIDSLEQRLLKYQENTEDETILLMIASVI